MKILIGLIAAFALCACQIPARQYAGVAVIYQNGKPITAKLLSLNDSYTKCQAALEDFAAQVGPPPAGMSAEMSCAPLSPFKTLTPDANAPVAAPAPKGESI